MNPDENASGAFEGVAVVTGANSGLGFETARDLAAMSPANTIILACRDPSKAAKAQQAITKATGNIRVRPMQLDVSSMSSVREFAARCNAVVEKPIDALICNAGIARGRGSTVDGVDPVFATNHLGHFLLTLSLLKTMSATGRVICVSSDMHQPPGPKLTWPGAEALASPTQRPAVRRLRYSYSKLCNLYFVYELSRRLRAEGSGITAAAFNPGLMTETNFARMPRPIGALLKRVFASRLGSLDTSGAALARLAVVRGPEPIDGHYFDRADSTSTRSSDLSYNVQNARELWQLSSALTEVQRG
jgi:NAD(P)-dependent dehydrogenase (short-subunit alcohol dehydrogenase family)